MGRDRQISTSLQTHPIVDTNLQVSIIEYTSSLPANKMETLFPQDFHQHRLLPGNHPFDIKYNIYSVIVS